MSKKYYINENGFLTTEVPTKIIEPAHLPMRDGVNKQTGITKCKFCNAKIKTSRMQSHLNRVHHDIKDVGDNKTSG